MCGSDNKGREFVALLSDEENVVGVVKVEDVVGKLEISWSRNCAGWLCLVVVVEEGDLDGRVEWKRSNLAGIVVWNVVCLDARMVG